VLVCPPAAVPAGATGPGTAPAAQGLTTLADLLHQLGPLCMQYIIASTESGPAQTWSFSAGVLPGWLMTQACLHAHTIHCRLAMLQAGAAVKGAKSGNMNHAASIRSQILD
jgi:hypothetical protein